MPRWWEPQSRTERYRIVHREDHGPVGLARHDLRDDLVKRTERGQGQLEVVMRDGIVRIQLEGAAILLDRVVEVALAGIGVTEVCMRARLVRRLRDRIAPEGERAAPDLVARECERDERYRYCRSGAHRRPWGPRECRRECPPDAHREARHRQ